MCRSKSTRLRSCQNARAGREGEARRGEAQRRRCQLRSRTVTETATALRKPATDAPLLPGGHGELTSSRIKECRDGWMMFVRQFIRRGLRLFVRVGLPLTLFLQIDEGKFKTIVDVEVISSYFIASFVNHSHVFDTSL